MLKTRRQIRTEQDRFGGYSSNRPVLTNTERNRFEVEDEDTSYSDEPYYAEIPSRVSVRRSGTTQERSSLYSTRSDYENYPDTAEFVNAPVYPNRTQKRVRRDSEAVMPSIRTRAVLEEGTEKNRESKSAKRSLAANTKIMLGIYAAVVVVLAAIVIATGIAIGNMGASVASMESELMTKSAIVTEQENTLSTLGNDKVILGQATEMGMVKPETVTQIDLLPMGDAVNYEARTNWFDKFCDWLSNLIGG